MRKLSNSVFFIGIVILCLAFHPLIPAFSNDSPKQKEQIQKSVSEFQKIHDEIMAIEEIELSRLKTIILEACNVINNPNANILTPAYGVDSPEAAAAWVEATEAERAKKQAIRDQENYVKKIEKANKDIKKLKKDSAKTLEFLKGGEFKKAQNTDPTVVYKTMDESAKAVAIYQQALLDASKTLLEAADKLSDAATTLGAISFVCKGIAAGFPPAAGVAGGISVLTAGMVTAIEGSCVALTAAGNSLETAANNAITDDKDLINIMGRNIVVEAAKYGIDEGVSKIVNDTISDYVEPLTRKSPLSPLVEVEVPDDKMEIRKDILKKAANKVVSPVKSAAQDYIEEDYNNLEKNPLPVKSQPSLEFGE